MTTLQTKSDEIIYDQKDGRVYYMDPDLKVNYLYPGVLKRLKENAVPDLPEYLIKKYQLQ